MGNKKLKNVCWSAAESAAQILTRIRDDVANVHDVKLDQVIDEKSFQLYLQGYPTIESVDNGLKLLEELDASSWRPPSSE
ncbi:unnamed protein product, partial [Amoebophrya sp. A25]|eukprot:GSA25T00008736001.1